MADDPYVPSDLARRSIPTWTLADLAVRERVMLRAGDQCEMIDPGCGKTATRVVMLNPEGIFAPGNVRAACEPCGRAADAVQTEPGELVIRRSAPHTRLAPEPERAPTPPRRRYAPAA